MQAITTLPSSFVSTRNGIKMPRLIYGTAWKKDRTTELVKKAVITGFRGIDTACQPKHYSEQLVGKAIQELIAEHKIKREDLFIQTKFTSLNGQDLKQPLPYQPNAPLREQVMQSFQTSQKNLQTDYVDSLVLHSPMGTHKDTMEVWRAFEELHKQGKVRQLGVSNVYEFEVFKRIWDDAVVKPAVIQNRFYQDSNYDVEIRRFLRDQAKSGGEVHYQSFWTLTANPHILQSPHVQAICQRTGKTPPQIFFKYLMQHHNICPLTGTTQEAHMTQDLQVLDPSFSLSEADIKTIDKLVR
jgi:diketogulonate reductase-like aldo/keto reductase